MSTLRQKVAVYLGLAEDEEYFDYDEREEQAERPERTERTDGTVRSHSGLAVDRSAPTSSPAAPRRIEATYDVVRFTPSTYADVASIGEAFRAGDVISMDLSLLGGDDAKRMIDFSSGLTFGLQGRIERLGGKVFLLTPRGVEVTSSVRSSLIP